MISNLLDIFQNKEYIEKHIELEECLKVGSLFKVFGKLCTLFCRQRKSWIRRRR
jgi:hypothetical protein